MFFHTWYPHPDILTLGGFHLRWYGLCLAVGVIVGLAIVQVVAKRYRLDTDRIFDTALILTVAGFIGARLYHVSNEWGYYRLHPADIYQIWNGGLAIHGGLLAGLIALLFLCRRWKWNPWLVADILAPAVAVGQAIGRWGNYFNQELFGRPTTLPWGIPIDQLHRPPQFYQQPYFHPTFLYESLGSVLILSLLLWLHRRRWRQPSEAPRIGQPGAIAFVYFVSYGLLRIMTESLRLDRTPIIGGIRLPILISGLIVVTAVLLLVIRRPHHHAHT